MLLTTTTAHASAHMSGYMLGIAVWERARLTAVYRNFLTRSYPTMKKHNPHTPILIREANGTEPTLYARFGTSHVK